MNHVQAESNALAAEAGLAALRLLGEFVDPDDCWFDHAGGCQAHGFISLTEGERCPNAEARDLLAGLSGRTDEAKGMALSEELTSVIRAVTDLWDEPLDEVHDLPQIVNALLASGLVSARRPTPTRPVPVCATPDAADRTEGEQQ